MRVWRKNDDAAGLKVHQQRVLAKSAGLQMVLLPIVFRAAQLRWSRLNRYIERDLTSKLILPVYNRDLHLQDDVS